MIEKYQHLAVYKRGMEILELTKVLVDTFDESKDTLHVREQMLANATKIPSKIAGAEGGDLYSIRLENAYIIKMLARELQAQTSLCKHLELTDPTYLSLLREELALFRESFKDWISSWDKFNDIQDEWNFEHLL